jgi:general secretion pathway protein A
MYESFFGLQKNPFAMTADPEFLYLTSGHREALAGLVYGILNRKGFVVLTGEVGTGKTTLLRAVLESIPEDRARCRLVQNPTLTPAEFLELTLVAFGVEEVPPGKVQRLVRFEGLLQQVHREGRTCVLIVDEAHQLSPQMLEEIRLLSNFDAADGKLLQIVLAGQGELGGLLNREDLRQLKQRIAVRLAIQPLAQSEVELYMRHRWQKAGATQDLPFQPDAIARIGVLSQGLPRLVNALCDNALLFAYGAGLATIGVDEVRDVARDLDLLNGLPAAEEAARAGGPAATVLPAADLRLPDPELVPTRPLMAPPEPEPAAGLQRSRLRRWVGRMGAADAVSG